jgi:DNA-binding GntR family transcriptional regulator
MNKFSLKIKKISITRNKVFDKLFNAIIFGYFNPGEKLVERELSKELGVSRTPIREALRELERLNLVTSQPYKGVIVNKITIEEAQEICLVRMYLEKLAVKLCIENINETIISNLKFSLDKYKKALKKNNIKEMLIQDDLFHSTIYKSTKNSTLQNILSNLRARIGQCRLLTLPCLPNETLSEHTNIYNAIKKKNLDLAEKEIQEHIKSFYKILQEKLQ